MYRKYVRNRKKVTEKKWKERGTEGRKKGKGSKESKRYRGTDRTGKVEERREGQGEFMGKVVTFWILRGV